MNHETGHWLGLGHATWGERQTRTGHAAAVQGPERLQAQRVAAAMGSPAPANSPRTTHSPAVAQQSPHSCCRHVLDGLRRARHPSCCGSDGRNALNDRSIAVSVRQTNRRPPRSRHDPSLRHPPRSRRATTPTRPRRSHLHADAYTEPEWFELEQRAVFGSTWQWLCHVEKLRDPGSYVSDVVAGMPIVAVRDSSGELRAFYNVCKHRAHELLADSGTTNSIVCPYHAWTYDLTGQLSSARKTKHLVGFDTSKSASTRCR